MEVRDIAMDFQYGEAFTESSPEAYERLVLDVLHRRPDAVPGRRRGRGRAGGWSTRWRRPGRARRRCTYRAGEWGPRAADEMLAREGRTWRRA